MVQVLETIGRYLKQSQHGWIDGSIEEELFALREKSSINRFLNKTAANIFCFFEEKNK